jgi:hypothetical protein
MKNKKLVSHKQRLDALFDKIKALDDDPELIAHWSRYLCVLVSGFIEASVRTLLADYLSARSAPEVAQFAGQRLRDFSNAKMNKILDLVGEFGNEYRLSIEKAVEGDLKDAVDGVVSNRHQIAHGKDVGIGFGTMKQYYERVVKAIEEIEKEFDV